MDVGRDWKVSVLFFFFQKKRKVLRVAVFLFDHSSLSFYYPIIHIHSSPTTYAFFHFHLLIGSFCCCFYLSIHFNFLTSNFTQKFGNPKGSLYVYILSHIPITTTVLPQFCTIFFCAFPSVCCYLNHQNVEMMIVYMIITY